MTTQDKLGLQLRVARAVLKMDLREAGKRIGVSYVTLCRLENGSDGYGERVERKVKRWLKRQTMVKKKVRQAA